MRGAVVLDTAAHALYVCTRHPTLLGPLWLGMLCWDRGALWIPITQPAFALHRCRPIPLPVTVPPYLQGNHAVPETNHTVVLGWNAQAIHVLRQVQSSLGHCSRIAISNHLADLLDERARFPSLSESRSPSLARVHIGMLQMALAQQETSGKAFGQPIVVLADVDHDQIAAEVRAIASWQRLQGPN